jgi:hypothetical protein
MRIKRFNENKLDPFNEEDWEEDEKSPDNINKNGEFEEQMGDIDLNNYISEYLDDLFDGTFIHLTDEFNLQSGDIIPEENEELEQIKEQLNTLFFNYIRNNE